MGSSSPPSASRRRQTSASVARGFFVNAKRIADFIPERYFRSRGLVRLLLCWLPSAVPEAGLRVFDCGLPSGKLRLRSMCSHSIASASIRFRQRSSSLCIRARRPSRWVVRTWLGKFARPTTRANSFVTAPPRARSAAICHGGRLFVGRQPIWRVPASARRRSIGHTPAGRTPRYVVLSSQEPVTVPPGCSDCEDSQTGCAFHRPLSAGASLRPNWLTLNPQVCGRCLPI